MHTNTIPHKDALHSLFIITIISKSHIFVLSAQNTSQCETCIRKLPTVEPASVKSMAMASSSSSSPSGSRRRRGIDLFFAAFFILHTFITVLVDAQVLFPSPQLFFPSPLRNLLRSYVRFSGDHLVRDRPPFFVGLVFAEVFFQLPLCVANAIAFLYGTRWANTTGLIYGVHTATTMIPILADIYYSNAESMYTMLMIYIPYLLIPVGLTVHVLISQADTSSARKHKSTKRA